MVPALIVTASLVVAHAAPASASEAPRSQDAPNLDAPNALDVPNPLPPTGGVYLPELTWIEVRDALAAGHTTLLVPIGGIEQNGPFLALGKHDVLARELAERVARARGDALVAPVVSFIPEGSIWPRSAHMKYPGTLSVSDDTFEALLTDVARSYRAHGFTTIAFLGDSGGPNEKVQREVARRLDRHWDHTRVVNVDAFYDPADDRAFLEERGLAWTEDGFHDDPAFTLPLAAVAPQVARLDARRAAGFATTDGIALSDANIAVGEALLDHRVARTLAGLDEALARPAPGIDWSRGVEMVLTPWRYVTDPAQRIFGIYLVSSLFLAFLVQLARHGADLRKIGASLFPREVWLSEDSRADLLYTLFGGLVLYGFFAASFGGFAEGVRQLVIGGLEEVPSPDLDANVLTVGLATVAVALVTDFAIFFAHWMQHKIPILWNFHRVHHSARQLTVLTVYRMHPVDLLLNSAMAVLWVGATTGVLTWLFDAAPPAYTFYGLNVVTFLFYLLGYNLRHSHVWLSYGPLSYLLISPAMHQIHHSVEEKHWDRNMGFVFPFWDWIFGTLYVPARYERITFGIGEDGDGLRTPLDFVIEPFKKLLKKDPA